MAKVAKKKNARVRRRERKNIEKGHAHIQSSFNNSIVTLSDVHGNVISNAGKNTQPRGWNFETGFDRNPKKE